MYIQIIQRNMIMEIWLAFFFFLSTMQFNITITNDTWMTFTPTNSFSVVVDPASPFYPTDFYRNMEVTSSKIFLLGSNNIVEVFEKIYPNTQFQNITDYSFSNSSPYTFIHLSINSPQTIMILTSYSSQGILEHLLFGLNQNGIGSFLGIRGSNAIPVAPSKVFVKNNLIYSYLRRTGPNNDNVYIVNIASNTNYWINLTVQDCSISVSRDSDKALVWDTNSRLYIFSISMNFTLLYVFNSTVVTPHDKTNMISFSQDGQLAIIQTDHFHPVYVINLVDFSVQSQFSISVGQIYSAFFLEPSNRFIYIQGNAQKAVYDSYTNMTVTTSGSLGRGLIQTASGEVFDLDGSTLSIFGMEIIVNNHLLVSYLHQGSTLKDESSLFTTVEFTEAQNKTVESIGKGLNQVSSLVDNSFSILFSTPLAAFFLRLFNYFTLNSLYVLLNIPIPQVVFDHLGNIYKACANDMLANFGFSWKMQKWAEERVNQQRPQYFSVSSDFVSEHFNQVCIYLSNVLLLELAIFLSGKFSRLLKLRNTLVYYRWQIYLGLVVSNMIELLLPWKYSFFGGYRTFESKMTISAQYILLYLLPFLGIVSLLNTIETALKEKKKMIVALQDWWPVFQTLLFPILVLVDSPYYFMVIIGLDYIFVLVSSFYAEQRKISTVIKAIYPIILHVCFFIFMFSKENAVLAIVSIVYLSVLIVGAIHYFIQSTYLSAKYIYKAVKKICKCRQIKPTNQGEIDESQAQQNSKEVKVDEKNTKSSLKKFKTDKQLKKVQFMTPNQADIVEVDMVQEEKPSNSDCLSEAKSSCQSSIQEMNKSKSKVKCTFDGKPSQQLKVSQSTRTIGIKNSSKPKRPQPYK